MAGVFRFPTKYFALAALAAVALQAARPQSLDETLKPYLSEFGLPALAAAVVQKGVIVACGAAGTRQAGTQIPVTLNDLFHLGSDGKAFTSLLAGEFVEQGKLSWNSTPAEIFPELKQEMDPEFARITLEQLLSHTSGLSDKPILDLVYRSYQQDGNLNDVRYWIVKQVASKPLDHPRGSRFDYSNLGYTVAGAMLERVGTKSWEELVEERIIEPLNLQSAGFGPQASLGKVDAPLGHVIVNGRPKAMLAGPNGDNPLVLGPAGTIHMSVIDFAKWVGWQAGEGKRGPALVSPETLQKMHRPVFSTGVREGAPVGTPKTGGYALGWGQVAESWASTPAIMHTGSNTMNLATTMFWPDRDFGLVMMTNIGGRTADEAFHKLAPELYRRFFH